ncbi:MAG: histidine kinase [Salinivirgaceae bacterium]|nr:histidine kinase [Salinivirgaceae bacterium]
MKSFSLQLILVIISLSLIGQNSPKYASISGKIILNKEFYPDYIPQTIEITKQWPIDTAKYQYIIIDTSTMTFSGKIYLQEFSEFLVSFSTEVGKHIFPSYIVYSYTGIFGEGTNMTHKYVTLQEGKYLLNAHKIFLEPRDSLHIILDYNTDFKSYAGSVTYSGKCGFNNQFVGFDIKVNSFSDKSFKLSISEALSFEDKLLSEQKQLLLSINDTLSKNTYNKLLYDITFKSLVQKHALIRASLYTEKPNIIKNRQIARELYSFMDTLELKSEYLISKEFRSFLESYLEYINRIVTGLDSPESNLKNFDLSKTVFSGDILKYYLFNKIDFKLSNVSTYSSAIVDYNYFASNFPNTAEQNILTKKIEKRKSTLPNNIAPELAFKNHTNKNVKISDKKGSVVLISDYNFSVFEKNYKKLKILKNKFAKKGLQLVCTNASNHTAERKDTSIFNYIVDANKFLSNIESYNYKNSNAFYLIAKDGTIRLLSDKISEAEKLIPELLAEKYNMFTKAKSFFKLNSKLIFFALLGLVILMGILVLFKFFTQKKLINKQNQLKSELKAIRAQLNPHFLFNSLNSIQSFINNSDTEQANIYLSKFARLMRNLLEYSEKESITLKEEIDFITEYIELEALRHNFKFEINTDKQIDLYNTEIPGLLSQPFIENAIIHGIAGNVNGKIELNITRLTDKIRISIKDNGNGFDENHSSGFGLKSCRDRINLINSQKRQHIKLDIISNKKNGTEIILTIPEEL